MDLRGHGLHLARLPKLLEASSGRLRRTADDRPLADRRGRPLATLTITAQGGEIALYLGALEPASKSDTPATRLASPGRLRGSDEVDGEGTAELLDGTLEIAFECRNGDETCISLSVTPVRDGNGCPAGVFGSGTWRGNNG